MDVWKRSIIHGVQWSERADRSNEAGKISVAKYINVTFPEGTYESLDLKPASEEDAIVYGVVEFEVTGARGARISDLLNLYSGGRVNAVNDNSNRTFLKNVKVVLNG